MSENKSENLENNENIVNAEAATTAPAEQPADKPKKLKRHFWIWPLVLGSILLTAGEIIGFIMTIPVELIIKPSAMWQFTLEYAMFIGIIIVMLIFCAICEKRIFKCFFPAVKGGLPGNSIKDLLIGLLIGFLMNGSCILAAWLHGDIHFSVGKFLPVYLIVTFFAVMIQSSAEEMVTRGYIYLAHSERYPAWVAISANAVFFAAMHLMNPGITVVSFLELLLSGLAFSMIVYSRQSLWMAYGVHTMWNFTQSILFGLPNSGIVSEGSFLHLEAASDSFFYDTGFGVEGTIFSLFTEIAVIAWCIWSLKKQGRKLDLKQVNVHNL